MAFDVFMSYAVKDMAAGEAVRARIEAGTARCWDSSRDIPFGADWDKETSAALKSCRALALIFSSHSNYSEQIINEVKQAFENGLTVMALRTEDEKPGEEFKLYAPHIQWVDALTPPMERHLDKFALQVKAVIDSPDWKRTPVKIERPVAPPPVETPREPEEKKGKGGLIFVLTLVLIVAPAAGWWFGLRNPAQPVAQATPVPTPSTPSVEASQLIAAPRVAPTPPPAPPPTQRILEATREKPFVNSLGMRFVPVPGTNVLFCIWDTRVRDYQTYADANPGVDRSWLSPGFKQTGNDPVVNESWGDAEAFCAWLTQKERKEGKIGQDEEYRLPTDKEWSAAAGDGKYPWGDQWPPPEGAGNYDPTLKVDEYENTSPVGSFPANQSGLYDMGGNVWQWCEDWYQPAMNPKEVLQKYPDLNDDGRYRVVRGGSWSSGYTEESLESAYRYNGVPENRDHRYGFRCVLVAVPASK